MWNLLFIRYSTRSLLVLLLCLASPSWANSLDLSIPEPVAKQSTISFVEPVTLDAALLRVQVENPSLAEMQARAEAMAAIPSQVGSLPDPVLSFNTLNLPVDTFSLDQEAMTQLQLGVSQKIPYPGKLALKESIANYQAQAANSSVDEVRLQLNRDVKTLWWRLFFFDRSIDVVEINKTLLRQFIEIAQTKYKVGQGLQQDVLLAQLELSKLIDRDIQLVSRRKQEAARLNALLNQSTYIVIALPELSDIDVELPDLKAESSIIELAQINRPVLAERRLLIDAATASKELAERDMLPDFKVGAAYGFRQGDDFNGDSRADFLSVFVGVTVPLFADDKQRKAISQRGSEVNQQQFALQDKWLAIQAEMTSTMVNYERARQQVVLFKTGIIPQANQTVASMLAGYQVNKVDFLNLVRSQITLYNYETNLWQAISEAKSALAQLVATVGEENIYE